MADDPPLVRPLKRPGLRTFPWRSAGLVFVLTAVAIVAAAWVGLAWLAETPAIPDKDALWQTRRTPGMRFLDRNGAFIAARGAKYGARVALTNLPPFVSKAFLAAEDRRFYSHGPVDTLGILRAAKRDIELRRAAEGGSTLSQQLARTLFLSSEHSLKRKFQEAVLASRLENRLGKDGVLELYLNRAYFGAGAYGLDSAAQIYFGTDAASLSLSQAAILAALPNAPTRLSPMTNMAGAWLRARRILETMRREGWIDLDVATAAEVQPPKLKVGPKGEGDWSYVLDQAAVQAATLSGGAATDLVVRLTVDAYLQAAGQAAVRAGVTEAGTGRDISQGAMVALAPDGAIRVMVGGLDHNASAFNRVTQARRQPGSSFKAFVFGAAMEAGDKPSDTREDSPVSFGAWTPENYGRKFLGAVTLTKALELSINSVAVRLTLELGPSQVAAFARRCGLLSIPTDPGASIALGAYEVTLLELAGGYQVFQNGGARSTPYLVQSILDTQGKVLFGHVPASGQVLDPLYASRMTRMLESVIAEGTGTAASIGRPAAGKTGTSQHWRDAWFVGFTPDLLTAVWVGNDDGRPMNKVTGGEIPARIWQRFMTVAEASVPPTDFTWLQPEPKEPSPEAVSRDMTEGPYLDAPGYRDPADERGGDRSSAEAVEMNEDGETRERALDRGDTPNGGEPPLSMLPPST